MNLLCSVELASLSGTLIYSRGATDGITYKMEALSVLTRRRRLHVSIFVYHILMMTEIT